MTLDEFWQSHGGPGLWGSLPSAIGGGPRKDDPGEESDWLDLCDFHLGSGHVLIADPSCVADEAGCAVALAPGDYFVQARIIAYGSDAPVPFARGTKGLPA